MVKKVILVVSVTILTMVFVQAQVDIGVRAGFNFTNVNISSGGLSLSPEMKPGIQFGIVGEITLPLPISLQTGILFAQQGYKLEFSESYMGEKFSTKGKSILNYIQIPVNAQYKIGIGNVGLLFQAGPYLGFALSGKAKHETTISGKTEKKTEDIEFGEGGMKRLDAGFGIGAGVRFGHFQAGIGYNLGLANIANNDGEGKVRNNGIAITGTYWF